jgi:aspartyl-tRNA(Asn)/glutamyl-tRNA(Gln) amidotransferase subunit A
MNTALAIAMDIREGRRSAMQVLDETIARIESDGVTNSFVDRTFERALQEAAAIDRRRQSGHSLPTLAGVPYAVKNLFDIQGMVTLAGGKVNASNPVATRDATLVTRMSDAGAVLVGTLNMDEHAYGFTTENTHYGATRNPHDTTRVAGGSSGGSAAAVAHGLVPLTLGSDTNGSIRVPASLCGTFGLKPTFGRLSRSGSFPFVSSLDHVGPFAANAADLAAVYDALQGTDRTDPACAQRAAETISARVAKGSALPSPFRIAVLGGYFYDWATEPARNAVQRAASSLNATAFVELESAQRARAAAYIITAAEGGALHRPRLRLQYDEFEPLSRDRLVAGSLIPASWVVQAQRIRHEVYLEAMHLFERYDLLIAPATPVQAPPLGTEWITVNGRELPCRPSMGLLTQPISCVGLPVCAVPLWPQEGAEGLRPLGPASAHIGPGSAHAVRALAHLPIGVQLIGAPWREDVCLAAAKALEDAGIAQCRMA